MRIRKHQPRFALSLATKQWPWNLSKLIGLKKRHWSRLKFRRSSLAEQGLFNQTGRALHLRFFRTYRNRTKQLFRRYFAPSLTDRRCRKLFRSNVRYRTTFQRVLKSEYRLDTLVWRLYLLPSIGVARDLVERGYFRLNDQPFTYCGAVLRPGDLVSLGTPGHFGFVQQHMLTVLGNLRKYYSRLFFKFAYPFVVKRREFRFREYGKGRVKRVLRFLEGQRGSLLTLAGKENPRLASENPRQAYHLRRSKRFVDFFRGFQRPRTYSKGPVLATQRLHRKLQMLRVVLPSLSLKNPRRSLHRAPASQWRRLGSQILASLGARRFQRPRREEKMDWKAFLRYRKRVMAMRTAGLPVLGTTTAVAKTFSGFNGNGFLSPKFRRPSSACHSSLKVSRSTNRPRRLPVFLGFSQQRTKTRDLAWVRPSRTGYRGSPRVQGRLLLRQRRVRFPEWTARFSVSPRYPWQMKRITKKCLVNFRYLKKFNGSYGLHRRYQDLRLSAFSPLPTGVQKTSRLYGKKRRQLLSSSGRAQICLKAHGRVLPLERRYHLSSRPQGGLQHRRIFLRVKRKYLRIRGYQRRMGVHRIQVLLGEDQEVYSPIQITYKHIALQQKNRPVAYYYGEMNYHTLDFTLVNDVDFLHFPYRTFLDFKMLSSMYSK